MKKFLSLILLVMFLFPFTTTTTQAAAVHLMTPVPVLAPVIVITLGFNPRMIVGLRGLIRWIQVVVIPVKGQ